MSLTGGNKGLDKLLRCKNFGGKSAGYENPTCKRTKISELI